MEAHGYYRQHLSGNVIGAANFELKIPYLPITLFYDVGNVWSDVDDVVLSDLKQDAGLALKIALLKFHFPFWASYLLPGEKNFEYRWLISLQTSGFTITL